MNWLILFHDKLLFTSALTFYGSLKFPGGYYAGAFPGGLLLFLSGFLLELQHKNPMILSPNDSFYPFIYSFFISFRAPGYYLYTY